MEYCDCCGQPILDIPNYGYQIKNNKKVYLTYSQFKLKEKENKDKDKKNK